MKSENLPRFIVTSIFLVSVILLSAVAYAETTLETSGNASGSNNSIQINQNNSTKLNQSNSADVDNKVNASTNTGNNSLNGNVGDGGIKTGDANVNVDINNQLNTNKADVKCKDCPTPTKKPGQPTPTKAPGQPTPTTKPGDGKPGPGSSGNGGVGGNGGPSRGGDPAPAVLGLAPTGGENELLNLLKLLPAFGFLILGYGLLRENA